MGDKDNKKCLYHASHEGITGAIQPLSRAECDFGSGFYMSNRPNQALGLVLQDTSPRFYEVKYKEGSTAGLKVLNLTNDTDWFYTVMYYRGVLEGFKGTELYNKYEHFLDGYDLVIGKIADDSLAPAISGFADGLLTDIVTLNCINSVNIGTQFVAKTQKGCDAIEILSDRKITENDRKIGENFKRWKNEKSYGIISRMNVQYKGKGLYISELIDKARELDVDKIDIKQYLKY